MKKLLVLTFMLALVGAACTPLTAGSAPPTSWDQPGSGVGATDPTTPTTTPPVEVVPVGDVPAPAEAGKQWNLTFNEDFNGTDYDHSKLTPCFDWNTGSCTGSFNNGREWYSPDQVKVSDGTAKLVATPGTSAGADNNVCQTPGCTYRSGMLSTARHNIDDPNYLYSFTYGYVEARLKLPPQTPGFFTAFWMLPAARDFNYRSEIDITEALGYDPTTMYMNYHGMPDRNTGYSPNTGSGNNGDCAVKDYSKGFSRFGLDWQPDHIAWYLDGVKCGQFDGDPSTIESGPMQIILDLMVDHSWERDWGVGLQDPTLTRQLEVDYLRVYQQK